MGCLFCNIMSGQTPSKKVYEDDKTYAFEDINPQSPVHILVIPKAHFKDIDEVVQKKSDVMVALFKAVDAIAQLKGLKEVGYRVIINNGKAGGQVIGHIHVHVMGGKPDMGPMVVQ